jgi:chromosomal replication initiation ATPase DnaA
MKGLALYGPPGSGKTHLAHLWRERAGARLIDGAAVTPDTAADIAAPVAIDDAERAPEAALLHLYNAAIERGFSVLVVAARAPASWPIALADLASRLRALPVAEIAAPDDALIAAVLVKHFADRQLRVEPGVIAFLVPRMERSFAAAARLAEGLDRLALIRGGPITVPLARQLLAASP